jgi:hypothetical protein
MIGKNWKFWINNCTGYGAGQYWKHVGSVIERYELWRYDDLVDKHQNNQKSRTYNL